MTPNFSAPACTHRSAVAALALGPSGACQRYQPPPQPPGPILIGTIDAMSIYETPSGRLSSDAPLFRRPGNRKRPPAWMNLPGGAQQRTAQTTGAKQSRARSLVVFQFLDVGLQFLPSGPATEVELKHLQGPLGRLLACPKADQQAGDDSQVDLDLHAVLVGCQQMAAAQNALEPAKKEFRLPAIMPPKRSTYIGPPRAATPPPAEGRRCSSLTRRRGLWA